jgi:hypothetical protein
VGLEISWYLRFARSDSLDVLLKKEAVGQAEGALHIEPGWCMHTEERDGHVLARFTREQH